MNPFKQRDEFRVAFSRDLLRGEGLEIGGGAYPQLLPSGASARYYDLRTDDQARELFGTEVVAAKPISQAASDFPEGADFLIAHNVLEHCPNPIGVLMQWNKLVRPGGTVIISLPQYLCCPDAPRIVPPIAHLIDDHLAGADGWDFASREHIAVFTLSWWEDSAKSIGSAKLGDFATHVLTDMRQSACDAHWHAFDTDLTLAVVNMAAMLDGLEIAEVRCWSPEFDQTRGDILVSYRKVAQRPPSTEVQELVHLHQARARSVEALARSSAAFANGLSEGMPVAARLAGPFHKEPEFCFVSRLPQDFRRRLRPGMTLSVREDGTPLSPGDCLHADIRAKGQGRYSFWDDKIYFSSTDKTDCNQNGRVYTIVAEP